MIVVRLGGRGFREDGGDLVGGEGEAGADGGERGGELRVVFADVLRGGAIRTRFSLTPDQIATVLAASVAN